MINCLYNSEPIPEYELQEMEEVILSERDSYIHHIAAKLISEHRKLEYALKDPSYMYAGGRIHRHSIVCRNVEIDQLRERIKKLESDKVPHE